VLTIAAQLDLVAGGLAVIAAVLPESAVGFDDAFAHRVSALGRRSRHWTHLSRRIYASVERITSPAAGT